MASPSVRSQEYKSGEMGKEGSKSNGKQRRKGHRCGSTSYVPTNPALFFQNFESNFRVQTRVSKGRVSIPGVPLTFGSNPGVSLTFGNNPGVPLTFENNLGEPLTSGNNPGVPLTFGNNSVVPQTPRGSDMASPNPPYQKGFQKQNWWELRELSKMVPTSTSDCPWVILKQAKPPTPSSKLLQVLKRAIRSKSGLANQEEINREEMALSTLSRIAASKQKNCDQT